MSKSSKVKHYHNSRASTNAFSLSKLFILPLIIVIAIIPLIIRMKLYNTGLSIYPWFSSVDETLDFFLYYKSITIIIVACIMLILITYGIIMHSFTRTGNNQSNPLTLNGKFKFSIAFVFLLIYCLLAILSTIFSNKLSYGINGVYEQFESIFVLISYCIIVFYAFFYVNSEEEVNAILKWMLISILILSVIGFTQIIGHDVLSTTFFKKLMTPSDFWGFLNDITRRSAKNRVYLTFYNPNYVGLYTALIVPITLSLLFFTKNKKLKLLYTIATICLLLCLVGSWSRAGFVGIIISFVFMMILFRKFLIKHWKMSTAILGIIVIAFFSINAFMGNAFLSRLTTIISSTKTAEYDLSSILTNSDNVEIAYKGNTLYIQSDLDENNNPVFNLLDGDNIPVKTVYNEETSTYLIDDTRFNTFLLQTITYDLTTEQNEPVKIPGFTVTIDGINWSFSNKLNDSYYYYNSNGRFDKMINAESAVFSNYESLGSGRGFIWSRTIPLLKKHILLGSGADTFVFEFPQNDYVGRYNNGFFSSILTRPHNMFLQMGVQTGVISLLAFLIFYGIYFISCIRLYMNNSFETYFSQIGAAIFVGTIGYMVSGLFNDSTVAVSPVFWALIGIGMAVNYQIKVSKKLA